MGKELKEGTQVKNYPLLISDGSVKKLGEFCYDEGLVLYFYPKDNTPGCTIEACEFRDTLSKINKLGYNVLGVSKDSIDSHKNFILKQKLNFLLVVDEKNELAKNFGVFGEKKMYGKVTQGVIRSTFILNKDLEIIKVYKNVRVKGHVEKIIQDLHELCNT